MSGDMMPMLTDDDLATISAGNCPRCMSRGFVIGPMGGSSINIECAAPRCRQRYNVAFMSGRALTGHELPVGPEWPSEPPEEAYRWIAHGLWSCGHVAGSVCAQCHQELIQKANQLAGELNAARE